jgi:hypothetical protein
MAKHPQFSHRQMITYNAFPNGVRLAQSVVCFNHAGIRFAYIKLTICESDHKTTQMTYLLGEYSAKDALHRQVSVL